MCEKEYSEMMSSEQFAEKKVYMSKTEGPSWRGKPMRRWKDRVKDTSERGSGKR